MSEGTPTRRRKSYRTHDARKALVLRKAFDVYDKDSSGAIDHEELRGLLQDLGWPSDDSFLQRAINVLDTDNSGEIGFSEFLQWTEFAYTARVLYRDEMCSSPVRTPSSVVDACEVQGAQSCAWMRRVLQESPQPIQKELSGAGATLPTVFEEPEFETVSKDVHQCSDENSAGGEIINMFSCNDVASSPDHKNGYGNDNSFGQRKASSRGLGGDDEVEFSAPITKMAKMALGRDRGASISTTSRIRSKSIDNYRCFGYLQRGRSHIRGDAKTVGPRVRSKATARMVWACEQLKTKSMTDDSDEEAVDTSQHRRNESLVTNMCVERKEQKGDHRMEAVSNSKHKSNRSRSRRFSCVGTWSRRFVFDSIESVEELGDEKDQNMKKTSSI